MSKADVTRERIVGAARVLFAEKGYDGATTGAIAGRAGVAEGTIYRHFQSKKDLFIACLEPAVEEGFQQGVTELAKAEGLRDLVRVLLAIRLRIFEEHMDTFNILFTEAPYHPELADMLLNRVLADRVDRNWPVAERLFNSHEMQRPASFLFFGVGLTAAMWFILTSRERLDDMNNRLPSPLRFHTPITTDSLLEELTDFVMYGLAGKAEGGSH